MPTFIDLREARKEGVIERFIRQHTSTGDADEMYAAIDGMFKTPESGAQTSTEPERDES